LKTEEVFYGPQNRYAKNLPNYRSITGARVSLTLPNSSLDSVLPNSSLDSCRPNQGACWATYCGPIWPWDKSNWGRWFCRAKVLKSYCTVTLPKSVGLCCSSTIQKSPSRLFCIVCYWRKRWFAHPWAFHCYSIRLEVSNRLIAPIVTRSNNLKLLITWY